MMWFGGPCSLPVCARHAIHASTHVQSTRAARRTPPQHTPTVLATAASAAAVRLGSDCDCATTLRHKCSELPRSKAAVSRRGIGGPAQTQAEWAAAVAHNRTVCCAPAREPHDCPYGTAACQRGCAGSRRSPRCYRHRRPRCRRRRRGCALRSCCHLRERWKAQQGPPPMPPPPWTAPGTVTATPPRSVAAAAAPTSQRAQTRPPATAAGWPPAAGTPAATSAVPWAGTCCGRAVTCPRGARWSAHSGAAATPSRRVPERSVATPRGSCGAPCSSIHIPCPSLINCTRTPHQRPPTEQAPAHIMSHHACVPCTREGAASRQQQPLPQPDAKQKRGGGRAHMCRMCRSVPGVGEVGAGGRRPERVSRSSSPSSSSDSSRPDDTAGGPRSPRRRATGTQRQVHCALWYTKLFVGRKSAVAVRGSSCTIYLYYFPGLRLHDVHGAGHCKAEHQQRARGQAVAAVGPRKHCNKRCPACRAAIDRAGHHRALCAGASAE